ncbi:hypothetical protein Tco_0744221 [Tanacetum coccineum]
MSSSRIFTPSSNIFFYNGLSQSDQDFLNTAASGHLMSKNTQEALTIIKNKAKVRTCRNKPQVSSSSDLQERPLGVLPSNTVTDPLAELNVITSMDGLTLDGSFTPHSNFLVYQEEEQEPKTITEVVEIASSKSTPLVPPPETPLLSTPKPKENLEPNPHQPLIPYPSLLQEEKFQALENPTGRADYFVYRIDIVDSLCDKFPIENNSMSGNPTPSSDSVVESLSPSLITYEDSDPLLEETDTLLSHFDNSPPEYETFRFDIEEKSSGSITTPSDFSLLEYDSFIFDLLIDPFPPTDRSDSHHEEFADELAHIISPPEYDRFYFDFEPDPGELTILFKENLSKDSTKDLSIYELNDFPLLLSDYAFSTISFVSNYLLLTDPLKIETFLSFPAEDEDKVFDPGIFFINGVFSFTRKAPHLLSDNFMIDKCHILSEISLMTDSVSFHTKDKEIRGESS